MALAVLLLIATSWAASPQSSQATTPASAQSGPESSNPAPEKQDQTPSIAPANGPSEAKPGASPSTTPQKSVRRPRRKKKPAAVNCDTAPAATSGTSNGKGNNGGSSPAADSATPNGTATTSKNCPPTKTIVRHGGTSEPSIQLAPSTDQSARQRDVVNQLLGATDANLKRIAAKELNANQRATAGQIRDYEQQSRAAVADGDLERARTLAWKAELLSEDLIKPQK